MKSNIILIGFMGCGKTTVGQLLAKEMNYSFIDTDKIIENEERMPISEIFEKYSEQHFRDLETTCIERLLNGQEKTVISVGGGLPIREMNRKMLKNLGRVIYLNASAEIIYERLKEDKERPLLKTKDPKTAIIKLMEEREEKYKDAAWLIYSVEEKTPNHIVEELASAIKKDEENEDFNY